MLPPTLKGTISLHFPAQHSHPLWHGQRLPDERHSDPAYFILLPALEVAPWRDRGQSCKRTAIAPPEPSRDGTKYALPQAHSKSSRRRVSGYFYSAAEDKTELGSRASRADGTSIRAHLQQVFCRASCCVTPKGHPEDAKIECPPSHCVHISNFCAIQTQRKKLGDAKTCRPGPETQAR